MITERVCLRSRDQASAVDKSGLVSGSSSVSPAQVASVQCLIVVDMQVGFIVGSDAVPQAKDLMAAVDELLARAREAGALIVHLRNAGSPGGLDEPGVLTWELHRKPAPGELVIDKADDDGFRDTPLAHELEQRGVQRLTICGVMSEMCVAATARGALQLGYGVVLAHNAHGTYDVPAGPGASQRVPAPLAARAAEWSLGDGIELVSNARSVRFIRSYGVDKIAETCPTLTTE
jgi:nicotinamidase-related amidase